MARRKFIDKSVVPPGGFVYTEPLSGVEFRHIVFVEALYRIRQHRIANGYPLPPGWEEDVEDAMCETQPPHVWIYVEDVTREPRRLHITDVKNFIRVVTTWMQSGVGFVPQEEAERRAAICTACPLNQKIEGCTPCAALLETVAGAIAGRHTSRDAGLQGCGVCSCSNQVQVHIPSEVLHKGVTPDMVFPDWCWKKL